MQIYAFNEKKQIIPADLAQKHYDYYCMECGERMRMRTIQGKRKHYFHISNNKMCRHNNKAATHKAIQSYLQSILPAGEALIEKPFPEINRIADLCWEKQGLIFEIQCSYIKASEIQARNQDYAQLGYKVIWILHEKQFYKPYLTSAENFLRNTLYYFTNMNHDKVGIIYDHFYIYNKGQRTYPSSKLVVNLSRPIAITELPDKNAPDFIKKRAKQTIFFQGDHFSSYLDDRSNPLYLKITTLEQKFRDTRLQKWKRTIKTTIITAKIHYLEFLYILLENICKKPLRRVQDPYNPSSKSATRNHTQ